MTHVYATRPIFPVGLNVKVFENKANKTPIPSTLHTLCCTVIACVGALNYMWHTHAYPINLIYLSVNSLETYWYHKSHVINVCAKIFVSKNFAGWSGLCSLEHLWKYFDNKHFRIYSTTQYPTSWMLCKVPFTCICLLQ